ncbi:MAG: urea ABC transporter ATP-binding protein UrtD [Eubacterium sp.]|nr:urea ABC transporter ATP-binding protein UrtD [Eubacterium sp.]
MDDEARTIMKIRRVSVVFDGFQALTDVTADIPEHKISFFIGPNGAGKTTLLDIICGKTRPTQGNVRLCNQDGTETILTRLPEYKIVRLGVARKFQTPSVFGGLSVMDNMMLSLKGHKSVREALFYKMTEEDRTLILDTLKQVGMESYTEERAGALDHGHKQWLEIAMLLVQKPQIIMLDEPAAGMNKDETRKTGDILLAIKDRCTIIVIEHDMDFVRQIADEVTVLHEGKILVKGTVEEALENKEVQAVYLGRGGEKDA